MKVNEVTTIDEGPWDIMRRGWQGMKSAYRAGQDQLMANKISSRLMRDWAGYAQRVENNYNVTDWSKVLQSYGNLSFPNVKSSIPVPKITSPGGAFFDSNIANYIKARTQEYLQMQGQKDDFPDLDAQPDQPVPAPEPPKPAPKPAAPDIVPQDSAGPSRMVSVHPYQGISYAYNVIKNQWINNRTNQVIDDPGMIKQLNISYNKANQRPTLYNMTPADKLAQQRDIKQRKAAQRARTELGMT